MNNKTAIDALIEILRDKSLQKPNWDSYDAEPIDKEQVIRALRIITLFDIEPQDSIYVCPLPSGGIQLEIEINPKDN